jgi:cell division septation protein DedD
MKGGPIVKPTVAKIDDDAVNWSLSWHPEGRCDSFTQEAIRACAPPTSGVYGLFNFNCQVFIGESANIQEALLRHERETDFQSQHLRPTGFTFEPCTAELCKRKAAELIAKFRPVLQSEAALAASRSPSIGSRVGEADQGFQKLKTDADHQEFPVHDHEPPKIRRRFDFKRTLLTTLAATFLATVVVVFYFGMPARIQGILSGVSEIFVPENPTTHPAPSTAAHIDLKPRNVSSINSNSAAAKLNTEITPAKSNLNDSRANPNGTVLLAAKAGSDAEGPEVEKPSTPAKKSAQSSVRSTPGKKWSVQISAAPAKDIADTLVQRLKAKGYDGYTVQAQVKGQTFYRVRVGNFDARDQAESVRETLARKEGYRDAYLTGD